MDASWPQRGFILSILSNKTKSKQNKIKERKKERKNEKKKKNCISVLITNVN